MTHLARRSNDTACSALAVLHQTTPRLKSMLTLVFPMLG
jgi:hypothetical protein